MRVARRITSSEDLLAPVDAIAQMIDALIDAAGDRVAPFRADLDKVTSATQKFRALAQGLFDQASTNDLTVAFSINNLPREQRHDMRTPMNHMIGYSELILEEVRGAEEKDEEIELAMSKVLDWSRRLNKIFDRLSKDEDQRSVVAGSSDTTQMIRNFVKAMKPAEVDPEVLRDRSKGRVLIADDNEINRDLLAHQIDKLGHTTVQVSDGDEVLARMNEEAFDLLLLDVIMPGRNGIEVLTELRQDARFRHVPVIMLSALDELGSAVRCIEIGAEDYIGKPFEWGLLKARIGAALEKKRLRDRENEYVKQIDRERRFSDRLLRVILPEEVIDELKETQGVRPRRHENVAVLFADIVSFTSYCEGHEPEQVVGQLQDLVVAYENLAVEHGMFKVKTIGDAFMATANLLRKVENPVRACIELGLDMVKATERIVPTWQIRTGVHVGPVVAGVLGKQQFMFDLWGDTVNTADRMCAQADPSRIALSGTAWKKVVDVARPFEQRSVEVKGKGTMDVILFEEFIDA